MEGFGPHQTPTLEENQFYKDRMTTNDQGGGLVLIFLGTTTFTYSIQEEKKAGNNLFYN